jgi:hypothetical protein
VARTTVDIADPILAEVKVLQKRVGRSMGKLVSELLAEALAQRRQARPQVSLTWTSRPMHVRIDLADKDALYRILDQPDRADEA